MIEVSRLHDAGRIMVNADLIETLESCPDTIITLVTKRKLVVADSIEDVVNRVIEFRRSLGVAAEDGRQSTTGALVVRAAADKPHDANEPGRNAA